MGNYYVAVANGKSLSHYNKNHGYHGWFAPGDGDGDGQTEYQDSKRRKSDSAAARERLDSYYKSFGDSHNYRSTKKGPSGSVRSANPYVDSKGNLTEAGKKRFEAEKKANRQKSKKNRVEDENDLLDPNKWVKDDLSALRDVARASKDASDESIRLIDKMFKTKPNKRLDLSNMSDKEIRDILNREILERQYNDVFNKAEENKGKEFIKTALEVNSTIASTAIAGLTIAVLIRQLVPVAAAAAL